MPERFEDTESRFRRGDVITAMLAGNPEI